jgi:hypothetical protein
MIAYALSAARRTRTEYCPVDGTPSIAPQTPLKAIRTGFNRSTHDERNRRFAWNDSRTLEGAGRDIARTAEGLRQTLKRPRHIMRTPRTAKKDCFGMRLKGHKPPCEPIRSLTRQDAKGTAE